MEEKEIKKNLIDLIDRQEVLEMLKKEEIDIDNPRRCWIDGEECPYGQPEGKFSHRPRWICHTNFDFCCPKILESEFSEFIDGIYFNLLPDVEKEARESILDDIKDQLEEKSKSLADLLEKIAKGNTQNLNNKERKLLLLVSQIIREKSDDINKKICLLNGSDLSDIFGEFF